jgi:anti-sigma-K factor RskA
MVHMNSDRLAEAALEGSGVLNSEEVAHLLDCGGCQTELARVRRTADLLRNADRDSIQRPAGHVWARIQADLAADRPDQAPEAVRQTSPPEALIRTSRPRRARRGLILLAAAAGLAVGIGGTIVADQVGGTPEVVASTQLVALPGQSGTGTAELLRHDGTVEVRVRVDSDTVPAQDYRELWLINTDGKRMYSIGVLPPSGRGTYPIPPQLSTDLAGFTIVDVSLEPYDGDARHSLNSVVRGTLPG